MPRREEKEIPIKIGGWDGKFVYEKPVLREGYVLVSHRRRRSNLHSQDQRPTTPPPQHHRKNSGASSDNEDHIDGNSSGTNPNLFRDQHQSNTNNFYGFSTEPVILPTAWSGKFQLDPNDVRLKQERNQSDVRDYADHRNFVVRNN